ncbi:hypothetical protein Pmar_PMAR026886 [Perkinsus marinus ATCC 50983]|uniref:Uncharacterized protein n=1 Tax=Perkinsus marinus (strain ATCC 50983 / TXsc) TaxID=423536 RepID=C5LUR2_PERM5|nr:hypothetical protein Pmar_PMAR026886 [Perkinsus marinus ATCC 50983]EEQ99520.1 hypothetical protein Pmar_PMAR026886 [Perkinsus marinus ATCC 50983]|eukprot:XP_002766803.1 hypothetical protein Pmar_PMAR026886 [Perkinsus marinus ATCC 50983]
MAEDSRNAAECTNWEDMDQRLGRIMTLAESKSAELEAALRALGVNPIPTRVIKTKGDMAILERNSQDKTPLVANSPGSTDTIVEQEGLSAEPLVGERTSTEYFPTSTNGGRKWAELGKLQSASELRKVEEAEDEPSGVDVIHEEYTRSEQEVEEEEDTSDEQGSSAEAQSYATMSRVPLDTRPCTSPRPIRREKGGFYCIEADDDGSVSAETWFASGINANRHLSLRTQRIGLLPRPSGGPQTSRAAIELNSLGASVAEFPRMSVRNEPPPTSSRLPAGSKFKFGYEPSVSTDVAPGLESYLKEIGSSFTARSHRGHRETVDNESPSRVRERLLFEMMKVYDDAAPDDAPSQFDDSVIN